MDNRDGMDITNVAKKSRVYVTNLGLSNKEKRQKIDRTDEGFISFGKAMAKGIEAHNFNSIIFLRTTTPDKRGSRNDDKSTHEKTIAKSVFSVGDTTTTATNKFHDGNNLEDNDEDQL